jgi:Uma2 family endonuclease
MASSPRRPPFTRRATVVSASAAKLILMTAQPTDSWEVHHGWAPEDARQRAADYTVEDILSLPDEAPRVELKDGVLLVVPSPAGGHQKIGHLLWRWFDDNAPDWFEALGAVGVAVDHKNTLEPDLVLLRAPVLPDRHYYLPEQVVIAVEVVSPGTKRRDRFEKPGAYAAAGVPHYWRIEQNPVHVYAYELDADGSYQLSADSGTELVLQRPFEIRLSIGAITP